MAENHLAKVCRSAKDKFKADFEKKHTKAKGVHPQSMETMSTSSQRTHPHPTHLMMTTTSCTCSLYLPITMATTPLRTINTLLGFLSPRTYCANYYMAESHLAKVCRSAKDKFKADFEKKPYKTQEAFTHKAWKQCPPAHNGLIRILLI